MMLIAAVVILPFGRINDMSVKIMITDNHTMLREGLKYLLEMDENIQVIAEAEDGIECLKKLKDVQPDVLVLDIRMPKKTGLQVLEEMKRNGNTTPVLILTAFHEMDYLIHAIDLGVDGYMLKDCDISELKKAIFTITDGKTYIQPNLIPLLQHTMKKRNMDKTKLDSLTEREAELLKMISIGMNNKDIAEKLMISERTVKNHLSSVFKKLDVTDRTQAAVFAIRNDFVNISGD